MVFQKPSLRTRTSFDIGMYQLGGHAVYLSPDEIQLGHRESIPDAARVLSRYADAIMARVFAHSDVTQLAQWATVPVINGLSDYVHPCQGVADLLTIIEKLGQLNGVRLTYLGDGNNVLHSLLDWRRHAGNARDGRHAGGLPPAPERSRPRCPLGICLRGERALITDPIEAVRDADVVYTDTWTSMGQEEEAATRLRVFPPYQINDALLAHGPSIVGVLHCLPAHRGEEITDAVADGSRSWLFDQAENRLHGQKAILVHVLED